MLRFSHLTHCLVINELGKWGDDGLLPPSNSANAPQNKVDPTGDGKVAPLDALSVSLTI